jgi:hypothetical protein
MQVCYTYKPNTTESLFKVMQGLITFREKSISEYYSPLSYKYPQYNSPVTTSDYNTTKKLVKTWAFIDMQNVHQCVSNNAKGWKIDWMLFHNYLTSNYGINRAVIFIGFLPQYIRFYKSLNSIGYTLSFRKAKWLKTGKIKNGNVDSDLTSYAMYHINKYDKAIFVADDGGYYNTMKWLNRIGKLGGVITPHNIETSSYLIRNLLKPGNIVSMMDIRKQIESNV